MRGFASISLLICILSPFVSMGQVQDTVILYNGQMLIGDVQGISLGKVSFDDVDLKTQSIKLTKVRMLKTAHRARIETIDRMFYVGKLRPSKNGYVEVYSGDSILRVLPITNINLLISVQKGFFNRVNGDLSAGFSYTKSNNQGTFTMSGNATYATKHFDYQLTASENASIDSGTFSRDREDVELYSNYNLKKGWLAAGLVQYQRNLELAMARRFQQMLGLGNKVLLKPDCQIILLSGITLSQELTTTGEKSTPLFELPVMMRFNFFRSSHPDLKISTSQTLYIGLTEWGRIRFDGSTSASWQLVKNFYLSLNPYTNYDSRPAAGSHNFDYGLSFSISYDF